MLARPVNTDRVRFLLGAKRTFAVPRDRDRDDATYQGWPLLEVDEVVTITEALRQRKGTVTVTVYVIPSGHVAAVVEYGLLRADDEHEVVERRGHEPTQPDILVDWLAQQEGAVVKTVMGDEIAAGIAARTARGLFPARLVTFVG